MRFVAEAAQNALAIPQALGCETEALKSVSKEL